MRSTGLRREPAESLIAGPGGDFAQRHQLDRFAMDARTESVSRICRPTNSAFGRVRPSPQLGYVDQLLLSSQIHQLCRVAGLAERRSSNAPDWWTRGGSTSCTDRGSRPANPRRPIGTACVPGPGRPGAGDCMADTGSWWSSMTITTRLSRSPRTRRPAITGWPSSRRKHWRADLGGRADCSAEERRHAGRPRTWTSQPGRTKCSLSRVSRWSIARSPGRRCTTTVPSLAVAQLRRHPQRRRVVQESRAVCALRLEVVERELHTAERISVPMPSP